MAHSLMKVKKYYRSLLISLLLFIFISPAFAEDHVLVIRGKTAIFEEVLKGISDDIEDEVSLVEMVISNNSSDHDIAKMFNQYHPRLVILMGNKAVNLYSDFQENNSKVKFPPAIAMAALFIDEFSSKLKNSTAIRYEIPAVTSAVTMRNVLNKPVKKIGVIYRSWMKNLIEENKRYCLAEGIELIGIELPNKISNVSSSIKSSLNILSNKVDAIWILNDNSLLTRDALTKAWLPLRKKSKLPAIVGIKQFITKIPLGSFAIIPDNYGLGAQAAGIIFEIIENNWTLENTKILQPVSVKKFMNTVRLDTKGIGYQVDMLNQIEEVK
ncbi:MAG: ABC-type uncharacterized transport system substrate-binding protein [Colwellia sp.]|jgi:ABC-type uncharacterized transport system substrate-binding protein